MKSLVITFMAAGLLLAGGIVDTCAQDVPALPVEAAQPAPEAPAVSTDEPAATPDPVAETAPAEDPGETIAPAEAPAMDAAEPAAPEVSVADAVPVAETAEPAGQPVAAPVPEAPASTPEAPVAVPAPAEPAPAAAQDAEPFELERDLEGQSVEKVEDKAQPQASFWQRVFGGEKKAPDAAADQSGPGGVGSGPARYSASEKGSLARTDGSQLPPGTNAAGIAAGDRELTPEEIVAAQEEVRRQAKEVEGLKALDLAYQAMERNEFDEALKHFNQALNVMPVRPHTVETRQKAMQSQAECEYRLALVYYRDGKLQDARDAIRRSLGYDPAHQNSARLNEQINKDETKREELAARPVPVRRSAEHLDRVNQIKSHIDLGRQYYAIGEYEKARREFISALVTDEKNDDAAAWLKKVYNKLYNLETDQMVRQQAEMIAQVRDTWTPPVKREISGPETGMQTTTITGQAKRRLMEKLNNIIIPELNFNQADIVGVIKFLDQASIIHDKDSAPGEKGVNFILRLKRPGAETVSAPAQFAEGVLSDEADMSSAPSGAPTVTMSLRRVSLLDALTYITDAAGLKYRIEENVVVITPSDMVYGDLITRVYKAQPSIAETITSAGAGFSSDSSFELGGAAPTTERGDVKKFFVEAGVPFPEGTSIVYKPSLNLLIVKNTADNLESFERILTSLNVVPVQVEIEARFVEVAQNDLEELGIEWLLTDNWELAENAGAGSAIPIAGRERIQMNRNTFTKGLRNLAQTASGITPQAGGGLAGIISISSILTNPEMTMILHALEQRSGANLLSAPKVTTKSGANAEIKVVKELIYPTEFELTPPQVSGSGSGSQAVVSKAFVTPAAFETRDTGVILNVTPTVGPDGFSIDLVMLPQVVELSDWINYGSTLVDPTTGETELMNMPQPIFHSRNITTSITIWDGQTVVMGGLITESQSTTLDKIPFLGDIPLLGYLFQSKTSYSKKFNLLIFVTANLVDPAGNKINKEPIATSAGAVSAQSTSAQATP